MVIVADALKGLKQLDSESVNMCVTSPPYYNLRDYGMAGQIGRKNGIEAEKAQIKFDIYGGK